MKKSILILSCIVLLGFIFYKAHYAAVSNKTILAIEPESITNGENEYTSLVCRCKNDGQCVPGEIVSFRPSCSKHVINGNITEEQKLVFVNNIILIVNNEKNILLHIRGSNCCMFFYYSSICKI